MLPKHNFEIRSDIVPEKTFLASAEAIVRQLSDMGFESAELLHGWVPFLDDNCQGKDRIIQLSRFLEEVKLGIDMGVIEPHLTNFFLANFDGSYLIEFCHESDFHFSSNNKNHLSTIGNFFLNIPLSFYFRKRDDIHSEWSEWEYYNSHKVFCSALES